MSLADNPDSVILSLEPFWTSMTMRREALFFIEGDEGATATLLFPPDGEAVITNAAGDIRYEPGRDYVVDCDSGRITLVPESRMPFTSRRELYPPAGGPDASPMRKRGDAERGLMSAGGHVFHDRQVAATYTHAPRLWRGPEPAFAGSALPRTIDCLRVSKRLTVCLMGDSISEGYDASGFSGVPPFQPPYGSLVAVGLERAYDVTAAFHNFAVAGSTADNGMWETEPVSATQPDLVLIAYGMNDAGYASAAHFSGCVERIMSQIRQAVPAVEFILVAPMLPHPDWDYPVAGRIEEYRDELAQLCKRGALLADVTSLWSALLERKSTYDLSGNGINHPNDFGHRLYAQTVLAALVDRHS